MSEPQTLTDLLAQRRPPDSSTLFLETHAGERLTYGEAWDGAGRVANALAGAGVQPGDRVAMQVEKSPLAILLYLACVRAGAVLVPMNPAYTDAEVTHLLRDAEPAVVVVDPARIPAAIGAATFLTASADGIGTLAEASATQPSAFDDARPGPDTLAAVLYTSGTTGRPKGAMLSHRNLASNAVTLHRAWGFRPDDVLLHALPLFHTHGLFVATNCVLANGTAMVFLPRFDVDLVLDHLERSTVFMGVPTFYTRMLADERLGRARCRRMRVFISGSAPLLPSTHAEFERRTGHAILERYGMTESSMITSNPLHGVRRPGTVGPPLPGVDVRVVDSESGAPLAGGAVGMIEVRGPNVFGGYWRQPERTASDFTADGFFRTGDLGRFDPDGYLEIVGRAKDLVISGGLNVYPREVEEVIDAIDGVSESAVIGVPDDDFGETVVAFVVLEPGAGLAGDGIRQAVRTRLAGFKVPRRVEIVDALPRNTMGKVEKTTLRHRFDGPER